MRGLLVPNGSVWAIMSTPSVKDGFPGIIAKTSLARIPSDFSHNTWIIGFSLHRWYTRWGQVNILDFVKNLHEHAPRLQEFIRSVRFFVAPFAGDKRMLQRIEGALVEYYAKREENFLDRVRHSIRWANETAIPAHFEGPDRLGLPVDLSV